MDNDIQKIIEEQLKSLPKDVKEAIVSVDYKTKLQEITHRQRLLIDQAGKLEMETTLVMIGLEPLADYVANLERELNMNAIRAKEVAMDVSENIFKPIRESLQGMNEEVEEEEGGDEREEVMEQPVTKFTNSSESSLNRDQILNEIENPVPNHPFVKQANPEPVGQMSAKPLPNFWHNELEIRPAQDLETVPGQNVKTISQEPPKLPENIMQAKMTGTTITTRQIVDIKPETKLPEAKKRPTSGVDPYREPLM